MAFCYSNPRTLTQTDLEREDREGTALRPKNIVLVHTGGVMLQVDGTGWTREEYTP